MEPVERQSASARPPNEPASLASRSRRRWVKLLGGLARAQHRGDSTGSSSSDTREHESVTPQSAHRGQQPADSFNATPQADSAAVGPAFHKSILDGASEASDEECDEHAMTRSSSPLNDDLPDVMEEREALSQASPDKTHANDTVPAAVHHEKTSRLEGILRSSEQELERLRAQNASLRNTAETLKGRVETLKERADRANSNAQISRDKRDLILARNKEMKERLATMRETSAERRQKLVDSLFVARERLSQKNALWDGARKYFALFRQGLLYDEIEKTDVDLSADTYLCLLPSTVPAALTLSRKYGGRVICDCVENVEVHRHSLAPNLHPPALEMVNLGAYGALTAVDGLMTVSAAVAETLDRFGPPVRLQPNYRWYEEPAAAGRLRERCGIDPDSTVLVTTGNIVNGFEQVIDAVAQLPNDVHLAAFVKLSPPAYGEKIRAYISERGLSDRIHLQGFVPYDELAGLLSDADLGLITLDPGNPNHSVSLPNRVFDFTTAGLPFVAPPLKEISAFINTHGCGVTISDVSAAAWAEGISRALSRTDELRSAMADARKLATWDSLEDGLVEFLGNPESVTLLGFRDLTRYQRFLRVTDSLTKRGIHVKAAFFSEDPLPLKNAAAEFYHFTDRYGTGPGLVRVPTEDH